MPLLFRKINRRTRHNRRKPGRKLLKKQKPLKREKLRRDKGLMVALEAEWEASPNFDVPRIKAIAERLGMKYKRVYKFFWDQNRLHDKKPRAQMSAGDSRPRQSL